MSVKERFVYKILNKKLTKSKKSIKITTVMLDKMVKLGESTRVER